MKHILITYLFIIQSFAALGQKYLSGIVIDFTTNLPLENVNVTLPGSRLETKTDSLGKYFIYAKSDNQKWVNFSLVGYTSRSFAINSLQNPAIILLQSKMMELEGLVVKPSQNPAWEIIREVQRNEKLNNPLKYDEFHADFYSKTKMAMEHVVNFPKDYLNRPKFKPLKTDSIKNKFSNNFTN